MRIPLRSFLGRASLAVAMLGLAGCRSTTEPSAQSEAGAAAARPHKQYTIEELMNNIRISGASFSPDESALLVSSDETGIVNPFRIDRKTSARTPVAPSRVTTFAISYFPKDNRILVTHDQGGNELNHLFLIEPNGQERDLTPGNGLKANFSGWSRDERSFFFETNQRDKRYFDLYRMDAATYEKSLVYENKGGYQIGAFSDDEQWLALVKANTTADSDIFLFNLKTKELRQISAHTGTADYSPADFDHDNKYLYYLTNDGADFTRVRRYDLKAGKHEEVEQASWDIQFTRFSHNGKYRVTGINEDGRTVIKIVEHATGRSVKLPELPGGEVSSVNISRSENLMAFYLRSDRSPSDLHVYDFRSGEVRQLTDTLSKKIDPADLVTSQVVRFKSFDGLEIPNILYRPHQATAQAKAPALVWVHGGPGGQTRKGYNAEIQHLVNHGYVVLGINNRGSSGYGKKFFTADDRKHGREPLWDCVEAKKYLASLEYVDPNRIGILGGSYGGYMVLAALAYQPDVFRCGVDIFGVANWLRTLQNTPPWWEARKKALYEELGDPGKDETMLREISPVFHGDKIRKPLLVLQGANDPRVLKAESDDIVAAVKKNGVPVEYVVFDDEGHGFTKKKNQIAGAQATLKFLDRYLKSE
jgi:dipeptidyl aminopeptidase/acylaminoacyl peptidase